MLNLVLWSSNAWADLDASLIVSSFQYCGITSLYILADFSSQLRHFVRTTELVDEVQFKNEQFENAAFGDFDEKFHPEENAVILLNFIF